MIILFTDRYCGPSKLWIWDVVQWMCVEIGSYVYAWMIKFMKTGSGPFGDG